MESSKKQNKITKKSKIINTNLLTEKVDNKLSNKNEENLNKKLSVYIGSYEGNIFCVDLDLKTKDLDMYKFKVSENSMKVITHKNEFIFASGIDETVHIYDLNKREEKGLFMTYSGSISHIFIVKDFILACGSQSEIPIWRMSDFGLLHNLKGHKKDVICMAVHKSAKFAISSAKDNTLIVWNLMNGLKIVKYNLKNLICNKIIFFGDDKHVLIAFDFEVWIFDYMKTSREDNEDWIEKKVKNSFKIFDVFIVGEKTILFGNLGEIIVYENLIKNENSYIKKLDKPEKFDKEDLDIRVKAIDLTKSKKLGLLSIIYSNNEIYIYDLIKILNNNNITKKEEKNENSNENENEKEDKIKKFKSIIIKTGDRLTCLNSQIK
jgi:WD40 repeat protein